MELHFTTTLTVEDNDCVKIPVVIDYGLTMEDLKEFVEDQGYSSVADYFLENASSEDYFNDYIKEDLEKENASSLEWEIDNKDIPALERLLINKYKNQILKSVVEDLQEHTIEFYL